MSDIVTIGGAGMTMSSFSLEERRAYVKMINSTLESVEKCKKYLPCDPESDELFKKMDDGVLLCYLVNCAAPGTIDERCIITKDNMNIFTKGENVKLGLVSAKSIGVKTVGIGADTFREGEKEKILIMGLIWQILKLIALKTVCLKECPQLVKLLEPGEDLKELMKNNPKELLLRWFNYHLNHAGQPKINNFESDLKDGKNYSYLLNEISKKKIELDPLLNTADDKERCSKIVENSKTLGAQSYVTPDDILSGNSNLNLIFTSTLFNACPGLEELTKEEEKIIKDAGLLEVVPEKKVETAVKMLMNLLTNSVAENNDPFLIWFNEHLEDAKQPKINNFGEDLNDLNKYAYVINEIQTNQKFMQKIIGMGSKLSQATLILEEAFQLGAINDTSSEDLASGDEDKRREFVKSLYNAATAIDEKLLKWVNGYLEKTEKKEIHNFGEDVKNGDAMIYLLNQIDKEKCSLDGINEQNEQKKAEDLVANTKKFDIAEPELTADDILKPNSKKIKLFVKKLKEKEEARIKAEEEAKAKEEEKKEEVKVEEAKVEEDILLKWFNENLNALNQENIKNFGDNLKDGKNYTYLLYQLAREKLNLEPLNETDDKQRCEKVIENAIKLEVKTDITADDINSGNAEKNRTFVQNIYDVCSEGYDPIKNWMNKYLRLNGQNPLKTWGDVENLKNGDAFGFLLQQLYNNAKIDNIEKITAAFQATDPNEKYGKLLAAAQEFGAKTEEITVEDLVGANPQKKRKLAETIFEANEKRLKEAEEKKKAINRDPNAQILMDYGGMDKIIKMLKDNVDNPDYLLQIFKFMRHLYIVNDSAKDKFREEEFQKEFQKVLEDANHKKVTFEGKILLDLFNYKRGSRSDKPRQDNDVNEIATTKLVKGKITEEATKGIILRVISPKEKSKDKEMILYFTRDLMTIHCCQEKKKNLPPSPKYTIEVQNITKVVHGYGTNEFKKLEGVFSSMPKAELCITVISKDSEGVEKSINAFTNTKSEATNWTFYIKTIASYIKKHCGLPPLEN